MNIESLIEKAREQRGSDVHLVQGLPPSAGWMEVYRTWKRIGWTRSNAFGLPTSWPGRIFPSWSRPGRWTWPGPLPGCAAVSMCSGSRGPIPLPSVLLNDHIPPLEELGLPPVAQEFCSYNQGLVLITGETGSGKSTTLASLLDRINHTKPVHILTTLRPGIYLYTGPESDQPAGDRPGHHELCRRAAGCAA